MNKMLEFDHEKETREILLSVLKGLERDERLLWQHRGFPHFGAHPCMVKLDNYPTGRSSPINFIRLDTFEIYPMRFQHVILDGIFPDQSTDPLVYRVERIFPGKNNPIKNNFYSATWKEVRAFLSQVEQQLDSEIERTNKAHMEAFQKRGVFRKRLPDFEEENSF